MNAKVKERADELLAYGTGVDCGGTRVVAKQDKHQVTRCKDCQKAYRRSQNKLYRKNRVADLKNEVDRLKAKLAEAGLV